MLKISKIYGWGVLALACACTHVSRPADEDSVAGLKALFVNPPAEYRSAPLWDWNEQISTEGIDFQMNEFKKAGIGGVFVHPRPGLLTNYLSEEWFSLFDYTVRKGKELGMKVWIYDENSYPSGFAGGHVPAEMPDSYRHGASLSMEVVKELTGPYSDTIEVILEQTGEEWIDITDSWEKRKGQKGPFYLFRKNYPGVSPWYGGFSYVDLIYPGVTEKFIDLTMRNGYERNSADFGVALPGVFTDEPNLEAAMSRGAMMRWTPDLWDAFRQRWGYDLRTHLPSLVDETGDWKKVRHDYFELLLELFTERWAKPWNQYCEENGLVWTGHYWEHGWPVPTDGLDEAAFYIWHQMPGVDMLGNRLDGEGQGGQFGNNRAVRELQSAANQAGSKRTLSETYGGAGWELSFEEQKRLVDWQCVLGVSFVNQHLSYYSLNGVRKFDYPPSFSYHEPWWEHYKLMGDYIGRVCLAVSQGKQMNRTLVLQPNTTAWMYFSRRQSNPALRNIQRSFKDMVWKLDKKHFEYDLGSEYVLRNLGRVDGKELTVGERSYNLVVIPSCMENIDLETFHLLERYLENGGNVLSFNPSLTMLDGGVSGKAGELASRFHDQWIVADDPDDPQAEQMLKTSGFNLKDITANGNTYHQRRILADGQLLFVVNSDPEKEAKIEVTQERKTVSLFDLVTGKIYSYPARTEGGNVSFTAALSPAGSALFVVSDKESRDPAWIAPPAPKTVVEPEGEVRIVRDRENVLVVNYLDLKTDKTDSKGVYFMNALNGLFFEKGVAMGNPWQHKIQYKDRYLALDSLFNNDSGFEASYHFYIRDGLSKEALGAICAVVERPERWLVYINGQKVSPEEGKYWIDRDFPLYPVGPFLKAGKNTLTLKAERMHILAELMPVYLIGDFSVRPVAAGFEAAAAEPVGYGSWVANGLPFYPHSVSYAQSYRIEKGGRYVVQLQDFNASVCEVRVNGNPAGLISWKPNSLDITEFLDDGVNEVAVKVYGSLKPAFGFFYENNNNWIFGPFSWNRAPEQLPSPSAYFFVEYGLTKPFKLVQSK